MKNQIKAVGTLSMPSKELVLAMGRLSVETGSLACLGCGHEHNCGIAGCAILREASDAVMQREQLIEEVRMLRRELTAVRREMDCTRDAWQAAVEGQAYGGV